MGKFAVLMRKENDEVINKLYIDAIKRFGGEVVLIYDSEDFESIKDKLSIVDGILLTGGDEVGRCDNYLIKYGIDNNLKILGICQGMQSMALYNTNNKLKEIGNRYHQRDTRYVHYVDLIPSKLSSIIGSYRLRVNSHHLQTVEDSKEFSIVGRSEDGLIEAVENSNHKFQIGVQWHLERMLDYDEVSNQLIKNFIGN